MTERGEFETVQLNDEFTSECVACGDFNRDGVPDVVAGPYWYEGPRFETRHRVFEPAAFDPHGYSRTTQPCFVHDFDGDGWPDVFCVVRPPGQKGNYGFHGWGDVAGWEGVWYGNPAGRDECWTPHRALGNIANEAVAWADVNGDGRPELVYSTREAYGYAAFDPARPEEPWVFHPISRRGDYGLQHGVGAGDISGNGRMDIVSANGWWEQPENRPEDGTWLWHPFRFAESAADVLVYDVDGDGLNDVITVWNCHRYGLVWYRQLRNEKGEITWQEHQILPCEPDLDSDGLRISQMHALALGDLDGDGLTDVVAGKRHWAHGPQGDVEPDAPAVLHWFRLQRECGGARFVPHLIHGDCGAGTQVALADLTGDGRPDVLTSSKKGTYVHFNRTAPAAGNPCSVAARSFMARARAATCGEAPEGDGKKDSSGSLVGPEGLEPPTRGL